MAWRAVGSLSRGWCLGLDVVDLGCMAYNFPKIGSTLFTTPVRTTLDLLYRYATLSRPTKHHHGAEGILCYAAAQAGGRDPLRTTRLSVLACGKSLLYVPQLRQ